MIEHSDSSTDPWLTLAEIAAELRVNPATVRSWVSRGRLKALRAGQRKWVVRRSELDRMLRAANPSAGTATPTPSAPSPRRPSAGMTGSPSVEAHRVVNGRDAAELIRIADRNLAEALAASHYAPPSPGYLDRIRAIADGFEHSAASLRNAAAAVGLRWRGAAAFGWENLPYELRPDGNRPGEPEFWQDFDAAVERLSITASGTEVAAVADGRAELRDALLDVADRLEDTQTNTSSRRVG